MKKRERVVFFYDVNIAASCRNFEAPQTISVKRAFELMELVPQDQRIKKFSKGNENLYVSAWVPDGNLIKILINKSDKTLSDPVFTSPEEKKRRVVEKEKNEGQDFSVHVVIKLPEADTLDALMLIEHCPGLSANTVVRLFDQILIDAKKIAPTSFEQNHPDGSFDDSGNPKKLKRTFKCEIQGHISDELRNDIDNGKIHHIELISEKEQFTPFDDIGYIREKCKTLVLDVDDGKPVFKKFGKIADILKKKKDDYSKARIKFKTQAGIERHVELDTAQCLAEAYVRKERLDNFSIDLDSSYEKFCDEIMTEMKKLALNV